MRIAITGATGLVGKSLVKALESRGHEVLRLVRSTPAGPKEVRWDPDSALAAEPSLEGLDAVVHLAGENIAARRWSTAQKERIRSSRVEGTRNLVASLSALDSPPRTFICASAVGFYGDRGNELLDERSPRGSGFLAETCEEWETEASRASSFARTVLARFGVILSPEGGALKKMLLPFKMGGGGRLGTGKQHMPWIALGDAVTALVHSLENVSVEGVVNVVAGSVTNTEYTRTLGRVLSRPTIFPMPAPIARLAFGEMAQELLLSSQNVRPTALEESGFKHDHPELEDALRHLLERPVKQSPVPVGESA